MKPLDWRGLLSEQRVPFIEKGPNVKRGELNVRCPWCGSADPSFHLGINLDGRGYACWRNRTHRGKSPVRLLMRLLGLPFHRARELCGLDDEYVDPDGFDALAARIMQRNPAVERMEQVQRRHLTLDRHFRPITDAIGTRRAWNYLYGRYFEREDVDKVCHLYNLQFARDGHWAGRIVLPYYMEGELVTWTGRAIGEATIRYKDLSIEESIVPPKETLYLYDGAVDGGRILVIVEGPIDALKLDYYARPYDIRAVALSTNSMTEEQTLLIQELGDGFEKVVVMMDNASTMGIVDSMRMKQDLFFVKNLEIQPVPSGRKDAGELRANEVRLWAEKQ